MPTLSTLQVQVGVSHDLPALSPCVSLSSCQDKSHARSMLATSSALGAPSSQTEASAASSALQVGESWLETLTAFGKDWHVVGQKGAGSTVLTSREPRQSLRGRIQLPLGPRPMPPGLWGG